MMNRMAAEGPWPRPLVVWGDDDAFAPGRAGIFGAETLCSSSMNMGAASSGSASNLAFFSRRGRPAPAAQKQNPPLPRARYDPKRTYVAFVVGGGGDLGAVKGDRRRWAEDRLRYCAGAVANYTGCPPLLWTLSPRTLDVAPDWVDWFYAKARVTRSDWFVLPPSGELYAFPGLMPAALQEVYANATEAYARLMDAVATVGVEPADSWAPSLETFYPRYAKNDQIKAVFPQPMPWDAPMIAEFEGNEKPYVILGGKTVVFRPREIRGGGGGDIYTLNATALAAEINAYPRGDVRAIYATGTETLEAIYDTVGRLSDHVIVVDPAALVAHARERG